MTCFILDTSALIGGLRPCSLSGKVYTTDNVISEVKDARSTAALEAWFACGLKVLSVTGEMIKDAKSIASSSGEMFRLSDTDIEVLALALSLKDECKVVLVTDDQTLQNICQKVGIEWMGIRRRGISKVSSWILECEGCGRRYSPSLKDKVCPVCGHKLKVRRIVSDK